VTRRIHLTGGLRGDTVHNTNIGGYFGDRHVVNSALAGLAGATFIVNPHVTLTAQVARGFRDPTLSDRFYRGPVGRGFIEGNPNLEPETSRQIDLTARWETGPLRLSGAYYDYRISNLVERYVVNSTSFFFRNRGAASLRGAEIEAQAGLSHGIVLDVSAQASRGRDADDGTPIDDIAPRSVAVVIRHALAGKLASYLRAAAVAPHDAAGPSEVPTPGFVSLDAGTTWHWSPHVEVRGIVRNLLDQRLYSSAGPRWVYAPGRNGSVTLALLF
jgi:outer membrane receptor protein involved in Fe transport